LTSVGAVASTRLASFARRPSSAIGVDVIAPSLGFTSTMGSLRSEVEAFIDTISGVLVALGTEKVAPDQLRQDCAVEAFGIACAVLAADGRQTDDELWELIAAFGPHLDAQIGGATPSDVRRSDVIERFRTRIDEPSEMFRLLLDVDRARGSLIVFIDH
jgi:hypothetical protein